MRLPPRWWSRRGRRRTPTILQIEALECGAAALAMVLAYHGRRVPLEELRVVCGVTRSGSKASSILRAAQRYGLIGSGFRREVEGLADIPLPAILHWNFNHYVVLEGIAAGRFHLNDPAEGPRTVSRAEFSDAFTGVVLSFRKAADFRPGGGTDRLWRGLAGQLRGYRGALVFGLIADLCLALPGLAIPALTKVFVDRVLIDALAGWVVPLLAGMAITAVLRGGLTWLRQHVARRFAIALTVAMASRFVWHMLHLPQQFFAQRYSGEIAARVVGNERIAGFLSGALPAALAGLVMGLAYLSLMASYDWGLSLLALTLTLLGAAGLGLSRRRREDLGRQQMMLDGRVLAGTVDIIRSIETIKAGALEQPAFARWAGMQARATTVAQALARLAAFQGVIPSAIQGLTMAAVLGLGSLRIIEGGMSVGTLVAFQSLMVSFTEPLAAIAACLGQMPELKANLARAGDLLRHPRDPLRDGTASPEGAPAGPAVLSGALGVRDMVFGYGRLDPPLIEGFCLDVRPGGRVALVGTSGSGKSTIGAAVCGLVRPWAGEIRLDGIRLEEIPPQVLAGSVAYIDQEIFLFEGTLRDNLTLWNPAIPDTALERALRDAALHEDIAARPGYLDCAVSEGGRNFSGGQRQRIEIARALVGDPALLVLDEATAALDPATEQRIDDNLRRRGCACLIIAHRLSTIRDCDEIVVLERGRTVERGTHETLLARGGPYHHLIQAEG
jgi:NHLM bacteriocin system ABC transporter peptidase/ATP-binding protein